MDIHYLDKLKSLESELKAEIRSLNAEIDNNKIEIKSLNKKNDELKNEHNNEINLLNQKIEILNKKINELEINHNNLKGRHIFKAFADYILLLFSIDINMKYDAKISLLKKKLKKMELLLGIFFFYCSKNEKFLLY